MQTAASSRHLVVLTGLPQSGKTSLLAGAVSALKTRRMVIAGIIAHGLWQNGRRLGFDLEDLSNGRIFPLARRSAATQPTPDLPTPFTFNPEALAAGFQALSPERCRQAGAVIVDEIGPLELAGCGWGPCLPTLLALQHPLLVWVVRTHLVEPVCRRWALVPRVVITANQTGAKGRLIETIADPNHDDNRYF